MKKYVSCLVEDVWAEHKNQHTCLQSIKINVMVPVFKETMARTFWCTFWPDSTRRTSDEAYHCGPLGVEWRPFSRDGISFDLSVTTRNKTCWWKKIAGGNSEFQSYLYSDESCCMFEAKNSRSQGRPGETPKLCQPRYGHCHPISDG